MMLLPCAKDVCQACAVDHKPEDPHNQQSLYYQYCFFGQHGRWPTWKDAIAHCDERTRQLWEHALRHRGCWSEPERQPESIGGTDGDQGAL